MKLSFVIPCYRSADSVGDVIDRIVATVKKDGRYDYEIICVNDYSPDNTLEVLKQIASGNPKVKVLALTRNFGQHSALMAGYNHVTGDIVVCLDDDGQNPPEEMFKLIDKLDEGYDLVSARYAKKKHNLIRRLGSKVSFAMSRYLVGMPKDIDLNSYCVFRRFVADEVVKYRNAYPFVHGLMLRITRNIANVDISHQDRQSGSSGYTLSKLLGLWMNGFTAFSEKPLRLATVLGFLSAAIGFLYSLVIIVQRIMNPAIPAGYSSLMAVVLILCGVIMLLLGLLGEYIGRIYICLNNAPQYAIREKYNCDEKAEPQEKESACL